MGIRQACALLVATLALAGCMLLDPDAWYRPTDEHRALLARLRAEAAAANARIDIAFDPDRSLLVSDLAATFVGRFGVPVAARRAYGRETLDMYRLVERGACERLRPELPLHGDASFETVADPGGPRGPESLRALPCLLRTSEAALQPIVEITFSSAREERDGAKLERRSAILALPDGGRLALVEWTLLHSGEPDRLTEMVARALRLRPTPPMQAAALDAAALRPILIASRETRNAEQRRAIEQVLAGVPAQERLEPHHEQLRRRPDVIAPFADRLVERLAVEVGRSRHRDGTELRAVGNLVALLGPREFRERSGRILAILQSAPTLAELPPEHLVERLGDAGHAAIPVMIRIMRDQEAAGRQPGYEYFAALCRIGPAAAGPMRSDLLAWWAEANQPEPIHRPGPRGGRFRTASLNHHEEMLYLAMRRMGLAAEAESLARHQQRERFRTRAAAFGPHSPPELCTRSILT